MKTHTYKQTLQLLLLKKQNLEIYYRQKNQNLFYSLRSNTFIYQMKYNNNCYFLISKINKALKIFKKKKLKINLIQKRHKNLNNLLSVNL